MPAAYDRQNTSAAGARQAMTLISSPAARDCRVASAESSGRWQRRALKTKKAPRGLMEYRAQRPATAAITQKDAGSLFYIQVDDDAEYFCLLDFHYLAGTLMICQSRRQEITLAHENR